ncbi:hypothetical protein NDN01_18205 [Sphingomonas sp. QA11]|uniref:hypothetical protein n=1 Tax=Sphingomonas sp. QA11 TaxID=2950605 RepID=UPI00234A5492|nr:hypothetical protein [Sphingomonas sp. QA11]WCM25944.1 hypothetical protein NDN01_18205 [Sphingomonas sp. QA11]
MLSAIVFMAIGFAGGVLLTAIAALYVCGLIHAHAVEIIDQHQRLFTGVRLTTYLPSAACGAAAVPPMMEARA